MSSCRVTRPKGELISQKSSHRTIFLTKSHLQPPVFGAIRCKIPIDKQKQPPYTSIIEKQCLIHFIPSLLAFILPGIDKRLGWSNVPITIIVVAEILVFLGYILFFLVLKENQFASSVIEVEKGQKVIHSGPYRLVRHPMYMGAILMYVASPLALGSYWAIIPAIFIIPIFIARIINEESVLTKELEGYSDYELKTRYRSMALILKLWLLWMCGNSLLIVVIGGGYERCRLAGRKQKQTINR
jgi:protein-S-isoprenylcysteine O-methyltransferase Ste14